jgi:hypothetical protein
LDPFFSYDNTLLGVKKPAAASPNERMTQVESMEFSRLWVLAFAQLFVLPGFPQTAKQPGDLSGYRLSDLQVAGACSLNARIPK